MPVVGVDARLLHSGPIPLRAAVAGAAGEPLLVRVLGDARGLPPAVAHVLRRVPALTLALGPADPDAFDLVTDDPARADAWCAAFERFPLAAFSAALLVRSPPPDPWAGLVAESAVYSMLQSGPEFAAWRHGHPPTPVRDDAPRVRVERHGPIHDIVLTRPARHNALDARMRDELSTALGAALADDGAPVVLRGEGPSFCSGGDLAEFGTFPDPVHAYAIRLGRSVAALVDELAPRLVVGLHGAALGAGIELAAFAGHVVAADDTRSGLPELGLGLIPGAGGTVSIPRRARRSHFLELLLMPDGTIPATTARDWGLVDEVVARDRLEARVLEIAESLP
jgi:enoyl-CoA hydratase/carnithine racemase